MKCHYFYQVLTLHSTLRFVFPIFCRMARILRLKQELAELHIPLIVIAYDAYSPRRESVHTNNSAIPTDQLIYQSENSVTPQRHGSLQDTSVQDETIHPIAQILITLCSPSSSSSGGTHSNRLISMHNMPYAMGDVNAVTPGPETATDATMHTRGEREVVPVLVTDDVLHPLQRHVHRAVTAALPALSLLAVDSTSSGRLVSSAEMKAIDVSNLHSYEQFCIKCESQKDARRDANCQELPLKVVYYESFLTFCFTFY